MRALGPLELGGAAPSPYLTRGETESTVHGVEELSFDSEDILLE